MPARKRVSIPAPTSIRAIVSRESPTREQNTAFQRQQKHTRSTHDDELYEALSNPDKILRKPKGKKAAVPRVLNSDNLLRLKSTYPRVPSLENSLHHVTGYQTADSESIVYFIAEDPIESWYTKVGYFPVLGEPTFELLEQVLSPFTMIEIRKKFYRSQADRTLGLNDRNVQIDPCLPTDPFLAEFHDIRPLGESGSDVRPLDLHDEVRRYHIDEWALDLDKAKKDELEATFQRTVMMSMLDRFRIMYNLKHNNESILDFAVESTWNCPFMPTRALKRDKPDYQRVLSRPKPDISVAFQLRSIIEDGYMRVIPEATRRIMTYEAMDGTRMQRAFHFLMVEAKNSNKTSSDKDGQLQNLNSASQSLHCLYEFFNEADRQEVQCKKPCCVSRDKSITTGEANPSLAGKNTFVDRFFKEVRVFTAIPTGTAITIRVHRACPASRLPFPSHEGRPPFQPLILPDYPLQFEYNELIRLTNDDYARERLVGIFEKIMVDYGIGQLRPLLQQAAIAIATKFDKWENDGERTQYVLGLRHYSHGQIADPPSDQTSTAASQGSRRSLSSQPSRPASSTASVYPERQTSITARATESQQEPPKKKRKGP
ncbi:hypothetical protein F4680DRAFT_300744 [Xylaria scruposa]|nr:hypothetical protein F4680DRAFT_300744 [Xylaria scruposa]